MNVQYIMQLKKIQTITGEYQYFMSDKQIDETQWHSLVQSGIVDTDVGSNTEITVHEIKMFDPASNICSDETIKEFGYTLDCYGNLDIVFSHNLNKYQLSFALKNSLITKSINENSTVETFNITPVFDFSIILKQVINDDLIDPSKNNTHISFHHNFFHDSCKETIAHVTSDDHSINELAGSWKNESELGCGSDKFSINGLEDVQKMHLMNLLQFSVKLMDNNIVRDVIYHFLTINRHGFEGNLVTENAINRMKTFLDGAAMNMDSIKKEITSVTFIKHQTQDHNINYDAIESMLNLLNITDIGVTSIDTLSDVLVNYIQGEQLDTSAERDRQIDPGVVGKNSKIFLDFFNFLIDNNVAHLINKFIPTTNMLFHLDLSVHPGKIWCDPLVNLNRNSIRIVEGKYPEIDLYGLIKDHVGYLTNLFSETKMQLDKLCDETDKRTEYIKSVNDIFEANLLGDPMKYLKKIRPLLTRKDLFPLIIKQLRLFKTAWNIYTKELDEKRFELDSKKESNCVSYTGIIKSNVIAKDTLYSVGNDKPVYRLITKE